jgi:PIN domain nuclease of toxin-antitoxin system
VRHLADTHTLLWAAYAPQRLGESARLVLEDGDAVIYFSFASVWEIAIKLGLKKLRLPESLAELIDGLRLRGFRPLPKQVSDAMRVTDLPLHHRDPFDRMLVAQAQAHGLALISADSAMTDYAVDVVW